MVFFAGLLFLRYFSGLFDGAKSAVMDNLGVKKVESPSKSHEK